MIPLPSQEYADIDIWYSRKQPPQSNEIEVCYSKTSLDVPADIELSIKSSIRQIPNPDHLWMHNDQLTVVWSIGKISDERFYNDIFLFPINPAADIYRAAELSEYYVKYGGQYTHVDEYLEKCGVSHLDSTNFSAYPIYHLFFLLTRFATYPFSHTQIELSKLRLNETNLSVKMFIDAIYETPNLNLSNINRLIEQIKASPDSSGESFDTPYFDWVRWADEYFSKPVNQQFDIDTIDTLIQNNDLSGIIAYFYERSDRTIQNIFEKYGLYRNFLPNRTLHSTRSLLVEHVGNVFMKNLATPVVFV